MSQNTKDPFDELNELLLKVKYGYANIEDIIRWHQMQVHQVLYESIHSGGKCYDYAGVRYHKHGYTNGEIFCPRATLDALEGMAESLKG